MKKLLLFLCVFSGLCFAGNSVTINETSGAAQLARPLTIFRVFVQGEIANFPHPSVNGAALPVWQSNVQTRWPGGSVQQALISFPLDLAQNSANVVSFINDTDTCYVGNQSACDASAPTQSQILGFNSGQWGAQINTSNTVGAGVVTQSATASTMIGNGDWRFWIKGPVANIIIAEDRSPALKYDFGWHCVSPCASATAEYGTSYFNYATSTWTVDSANHSLHPTFVLTQYQGWPGVKVEYILENDWITNLQDQGYNLTLNSGQSLATVQYSLNSMVQIARSRWRKTFWDGQAPGAVNIDFNLPYLIASKAVVNYDTSKVVPASAITTEVARWTSSDEANIASIGTVYGGTVYKGFPSTGGREDIGLIPEWGALYLFSMNPVLYQEVIGDAEAMGYAPNHFRESVTTRFYDDLHTVNAIGYPVSDDARPGFVSRQQTGLSAAADAAQIVGGTSYNNWQSSDVAHQPDPMYLAYLLTGDWYLLEEIYFWAAYDLTASDGGTCSYCRHNDWGFMSESLGDTRGIAWTMRNLAHAAWVAPDGTPEKTYFLQKLNYNIAVREGIMNITDGAFNASAQWTWGRTILAANQPDPLYWASYNMGASNTTGNTQCDMEAPWEENYLNIVLGHIVELGFNSATSTQQTIIKGLLHMILDPTYTPKSLIANYWEGTRAYNTGCINPAPFTTWTQVVGDIPASEVSASATRWAAGAADATGGYPTIALGASSFLVGINDGALLGSDAWAWMQNNVVDQANLNNNPMWAIIPRTQVVVNTSLCDLNADGVVNVVDVQLAIAQVLGSVSCGSANLLSDGCTVTDVQLIINAALGLGCLVP